MALGHFGRLVVVAGDSILSTVYMYVHAMKVYCNLYMP